MKAVIIMADDDRDDCMFASEAFKESNIDAVFHCVEDGFELMDYLRRSIDREVDNTPFPDLVLLDLNMPRKDGRQVLKEIKSTPAFGNIPVVVFSTSLEAKDIAFSREMEAGSFRKPAVFQEWVDIAKYLVDNFISGTKSVA